VDKLITDDDDDKPVRVAEEASAMIDADMIDKAVNETVELFKDGFQSSDIFPALSNLMEMAEVVEGASGEEKKLLVVEAAKRVYDKLDPDISSWVPQFIEHKVVNWALDAVLPSAVDWAIGLTKGKLNVNSPSD